MPREVCSRCGTPGPECAVCGGDLTLGRSVFLYEGAAGAAVRRLKYARVQALGPALGELLAGSARPFEGADMVVPVPIHSSRRHARTFNQSELLARPVAEALGVPLVTGVLVRWRRTPAQAGSRPELREANVAGAFRVPNRGRVTGRTALLIDDVWTSGATLRECARTLKRAGADIVTALTLCREQ